MEHIIIIPKENGYVLLQPEITYILFNKVTKTYHSEAIVKEQKKSQFIAVPEINE